VATTAIRGGLLTLAFLLPLTWFAAAALAQKKVALVIGNAAYKEAPLKNPVNDARAMAARLRQLGFQVIARENAGKAQMEAAVLEFGEALGAGAVGMFYFAGHGLQVNGRNFLVPVDATMRSEQRVRLETLDVDILLDQMDVAKSSVNLVVLDACRNNPFERRLRSTGSGLAQINAPQGTLIAYATAPGRVAADGEGANGIYTAHLLRHMGAPGLAVEEMFKRVRADVSRETNGAQTPWESSSLTGGFFFVEPAPPPVAAAPKPEPPPPAPAPAPQFDREALFWQSIGSSNDPALLQAYLTQYPNGVFAPLARAKIASAERRRKEEEEQKARAKHLAAAPPPSPAPSPPPAQQAAAPVPAPVSPPVPPSGPQSAPPSPGGSADDRWSGRGAVWRFDLRLVGDQLTGTGRATTTSGEYSVSGRVDPVTNEVSGVLSHPRLFAASRIAGRFPTLNVITNGPGSDTVLLEPAPGGTPRSTTPIPASAPAAASRDGIYVGKGGAWTVEATIEAGRIWGKATNVERSGQWELSGDVDARGRLNGRLSAAHQFGGVVTFAGTLPTLEVQGISGARIPLERK